MSSKFVPDQFLRSVWKKPECFTTSELSADIEKWLLFPGSFSKKVLVLSSKKEPMRIHVLQEGLEVARTSSPEFYCFNCRFIYIREIQIFLGDSLVMYARSVMPKDAISIYKRRFRGLGSRPLGQMLFSTSDFRRSPFELAKIWPRDSEYRLATSPSGPSSPFLWGRRSLFSTEQNLLLLTEVFSPNLIGLILANETRAQK